MHYGDVTAVDGIGFTVEPGEFFGLLGPNGAGKTTTIEILEGFRARSAGHVEVLGADPIHGGEDWKARIGVVLQSWRDHPRWTPRQLLTDLGGYFAPYSTPERTRPYDIDELIVTTGLSELADTKISTLSGGQRRRLDVAIGIVGRPELLFLDEPTAGLDPIGAAAFDQLICELRDALGLTVFLITHDLDTLYAICDRVAVIADRKVVAIGTIPELLALDHDWIQSYFNGPRGRAAARIDEKVEA